MEYRFVGIWAWTSRQSSWETLNCAAKALSVPTQGSMNPSIFGFVYLKYSSVGRRLTVGWYGQYVHGSTGAKHGSQVAL